MAKAADHDMTVRTSVTVPLAPDEAFRLFTERMATWWPLATHSVHEAEATSVVVEPAAGGRIFETAGDGRTAEWGRVTAWVPGEHFATTWHPGNDPALATHVDVRFTPAPEGGTRVDLVHTGWEVRGADAPAIAAGYETGWAAVLGRFVEAAT